MNKDIKTYNDLKLYSMLQGPKSDAEAAFAELYARYSQRVYAYCLRVTGSVDDSQDIFQEAFIKFFNTAKTREKIIDNIPGFLIITARNICLNYKRDKRSDLNIEDYNMSTNDVSIEQKELLKMISSAIELLDFEFREAFILRQYHDLSYQEISEITGETVSCLKNRVFRAKEKLKDILQPYLENYT